MLTYCDENNVKVVARGAGTSLSGGALPLEDGVLVSMMKFNKINEPMKVAAPSDNPSRLGTHSNPCDHYGCEGETGEIVLRIAVISGCDAPPVLELAEHAFDEISAFVGPAVQRIGRPA